MVGDYAIGPEAGDVDANNKWLVDLEVRHVDTSQLSYINIIKLSSSALGRDLFCLLSDSLASISQEVAYRLTTQRCRRWSCDFVRQANFTCTVFFVGFFPLLFPSSTIIFCRQQKNK